MHPTTNMLSENIRAQSIALLNEHLAAAIDLHAQLKQAHWNVRGSGFMAIHELFDRVAGEVETMSDTIAERSGGLGGTAEGTVQVSANKTFLPTYPLGIGTVLAHVDAISIALSHFGNSSRKAISMSATAGDPATADLFTEIVRQVDQQLWFVESHKDVA